MNINGVLDLLKEYPGDSLIYNAGCYPNWVKGNDGNVALSMEPVPVQRVKDLIRTLEQVQYQDLPNQDIAFRRRIYSDTELHMTSAFLRNGQYYITVEVITRQTIKSWFCFAKDSMPVDVVVGHPTYVLGGNQLTVLVNEPYFNALGDKGRIEYLDRLLNTKAFHYRDSTTGKDVFYNEEHWGIIPKPKDECECPQKDIPKRPNLVVAKELSGFSEYPKPTNVNINEYYAG